MQINAFYAIINICDLRKKLFLILGFLHLQSSIKVTFSTTMLFPGSHIFIEAGCLAVPEEAHDQSPSAGKLTIQSIQIGVKRTCLGVDRLSLYSTGS